MQDEIDTPPGEVNVLKRRNYIIKHYEASRNDIQSGVVIRVGLNGYSSQVLLDSGAQPSIVDVQSLKAIGLDYKLRRSKVHGVCATPIETMGEVELCVDVRKGEVMNHKFTILRSPEPTVILGMDFLRRYTTIEFDWANHRLSWEISG